jgi:hypothetical protein
MRFENLDGLLRLTAEKERVSQQDPGAGDRASDLKSFFLAERLSESLLGLGKGALDKAYALGMLRACGAIGLRCNRMNGQKLFLYATKTRTLVYTKLPQFLAVKIGSGPPDAACRKP